MTTNANIQAMTDAITQDLINAAKQAGRDWFDRAGDREAPLSGEFGGESIPELSDFYGLDLTDRELADAFEEGFYEAQDEEQPEEATIDPSWNWTLPEEHQG